MLYLVRMIVDLPHDLNPQKAKDLKTAERERCQELQRSGEWAHIWRVAGRYENYSVFDVDSHARLHEILSELPLFPFMDVDVTPLAPHPSTL